MRFIFDVRLATRTLLRRPSFALAAVLTLGLGVGANTAVFSAVHGIVWRPLAFERPEELVALWPDRAFNTRELVFLRDHMTQVAGLTTVAGWSVALTDVDEPTQLSAARTSAEVFSLLGVSPMIGRWFRETDVRVGANHGVMLSYRLWAEHFGADSALVDGTITIDGTPHRVLGVMPRSFELLSPNRDLWIPLIEDPNRWQYTGNFSQMIGRLVPGASVATAKAEFLGLLDRMREEYSYADTFGETATVISLKERLVGSYRGMLFVILGAVGFILLIAGANLSSLLLAKALDRRRELATRAALGASRGRLVQMMLIESLVLSLAGGVAGLAMAYGGVGFLKTVLPATTPRMAGVSVDGLVLAACFTLAIATGVLFSLAPAVTMSRVRLAREVGGQRTTGGSGGGQRMRQGFVVLQIALAVILVVGAGLMMQTTFRMAAVDPGFAYDKVLTMRLFPVGAQYDTPEEYRRLYIDLFERLEAIPGIEVAGAVQHLPMSEIEWGTPVEIEGQPLPDGRARPVVGWRITSGRYFESMGIRLLEGRAFAASDRATSVPVAVVNRAFANRFWPGESALGRRFLHGTGSTTMVTVVGMIDDLRHTGIIDDAAPEIYRPHSQSTMPALMLALRTDGEPDRMGRTAQAAIWSVDPNIPVADVIPLRELVDASYADTRLMMLLLSVFAAVALALGAVGVYGVTAFVVSRRTNEFGIRIALGASSVRVQRVVLWTGFLNALLGIGAGLVAAAALTRFLGGFLYGVSATDPLTFLAVPIVILLATLMASYIPARRATRIDPARALRES